MIRSREAGSDHGAHLRVALFAGLIAGLLGIYPHVRWSLELHQTAWFFNSYDEGFYGWLSIHEFSFNRGLSSVVMHALYFLSGANNQLAMILADFFLPCGAVLACCYTVRPLFVSATGMAAAALTVLVSAECLALRSTSIPYHQLHPFLQKTLQPMTGGPAGIFQLENQTSTFWIFRTPEPQVSWIIMYLTLGLALRRVLNPAPNPWSRMWFAVSCVAVGIGYLFCGLSVGGALVLFALLAARSHPRLAGELGVGGVLALAVCLGSALWSARQWGGDSLLFDSHVPLLTVGSLLGLFAAALALLGGLAKRRFPPLRWLAIALGLTPACMANQQWVTGHMIGLVNFENFAFPQLAALAGLITISPALNRPAEAPPHRSSGVRAIWFPGLVLLLLGWITLRSQLLSYRGYLETNRQAKSYAVTLQAIPLLGKIVVCDDFYATEILAVILGYRPPFLIARDMVFSDLIARLKNPQELPANGAKARLALFEYLALTGTTPDEFSRRFDAITDPANPNWQDRFLLGGFLYHQADFWAPLTHGRGMRLAWIEAQKSRVVEAYAHFLVAGDTSTRPIVFIMRQDKPAPEFLARHQARALELPPTSSPLPMKAYLLEGGANPTSVH